MNHMHDPPTNNSGTFAASVVQHLGFDATRLIEYLITIQSEYSYIPPQAISKLSELLGIPNTQITAAVEFYSFLSLRPQGKYRILLSDSITDRMLGSRAILKHWCKSLGVKQDQLRADERVSISTTSCTGLCDQGPAGLVNGKAVVKLDKARIDQMVGLIESNTPTAQWPKKFFDVKDQIYRRDRILSDPLEPGAALASLKKYGSKKILADIADSGLRGRGGAGFGTALKWRSCRTIASNTRYVVCNADEGEPGTFKDRVLLNTVSDTVIEGMTVCARIIGAKTGYIYLRGEYSFLLDNLTNKIENRRQHKLLGQNIFGMEDFDFDIEIRQGAGAYICGEESALIESLEGKRGIPRNRPPYPVTHGFQGLPTVVNNVETFAAAAKIAALGADWFNRCGTTRSAGTKLLSVSGDCEKPGIYEYPFGVGVEQILQDCKARDPLGVLVGGPSGTFIAPYEFDRKIAFEDLSTGGSFMIFDHNRNLLDIVLNFTHFFAHESCGFCTPCRVGTSLLAKTLEKITRGLGSIDDLNELQSLCTLVKQYSHCGLGQSAANPIIDTLQRYPELYQQALVQPGFQPGFDMDTALEPARKLRMRLNKPVQTSQLDP